MDRSLPAAAAIRPVGYRFADLRLEADGTLLRGETVFELPAQELSLLRALLARPGEAISPDELNRALWGATDPFSYQLAACLASLKKRLQPADCIESVDRCGYRITAIVEADAHLRTHSLPLVAILPFSTGYEVPEYYGLAIAELAMEQLERARPAVVSIAAPESVLTLARRELPRQQIGKMLDADLLLTGQVMATPGRYRLRAEMMRVEDGAPLWVEDLIVEREQIAELARDLADCVRLRLHREGIPLQAEAAPVVQRETSAARREARDLYFRAHHEWQSMERHSMQDAMRRLLRAVELDPSLMAARVDLAHLAIFECIHGYMSTRIAAAAVRRAADGIPALNEKAEALLPALGWIEFHFDREARSALRMTARAEGLPYDASNTRVRSWLLLSRGRIGEGVELLRAAIRHDAYSPGLQTALGWALHLGGERDASVAQARDTVDAFPEYDNSLFFGAMILAHNGEAGRAIEIAETLAARAPHYDLAISAHAYALACAGRAEESHNLLERLQWLSRERFVLKTLNAATHVVLGEADLALAELRLANESRCPWFFQTLADPRLAPLRGRPEFAALASTLAAMEAGA